MVSSPTTVNIIIQALSLPAGTQNLVNHGNALLAEYNQQGLAIHQIAFKQKAVGTKIEEMVAKFNTHEVMSNPKDTIAVLQEVKSSFEVIKANINTLETKVVSTQTTTVSIP